jgi:hypothetical protein
VADKKRQRRPQRVGAPVRAPHKPTRQHRKAARRELRAAAQLQD